MNRRLSLAAGAAFAALVAFTAPSFAQQSTPTPAPTSVVVPDLAFILKAAQGGMEEVALGDLARQQAADDKVKKFGEHMVNDHTKANQDLMQLATNKGIDLPGKGTDPGSQMVAAALSARNGHQFDLQYIAQQVAAHEVTVTLFKFASEHATDPEVKSFAKKYEPTVAEHLKEAQTLMKGMMKQG